MGISGSIAPKISYLTRLGLRVKPWISMRISLGILGMGLRGPDIRPGFDNRHLIIEGQRRLLKVMEDLGRS